MDDSANSYRIVKITSIVIFCFLLFGGCESEGIRLTVENTGSGPMDSVTVHVTGNQYFLGRIPPNERRSIGVQVTGESHVELEQPGHQRLKIDIYLEPGYEGIIRARVSPDSIHSVSQKINVGM